MSRTKIKSMPGQHKPKHVHAYVPILLIHKDKSAHRVTKLVHSYMRPGTSGAEVPRYDKMVKVECVKCGRITWLPEKEVNGNDQGNQQSRD